MLPSSDSADFDDGGHDTNQNSEDNIRISESNSETEHDEDSISSTSDSEDVETDGAIMEYCGNEKPPEFGNICVKNSSDIHIGNKTVYQGPVTIKQFVYTNPSLEPSNEEGPLTKIAIKNGEIVLPIISEKEVQNTSNGVVKNGSACVINNGTNHTGIHKNTKWLHSWSTKRVILIISALITILITLITVTTILLSRHLPPVSSSSSTADVSRPDEQDHSTPIESPVDKENGVHLSGRLMIIPRKQWLAQPPEQQADRLKLPVPYVIIWHTATENCTNQADCVYQVRNIQTFHMESKHWWDIGYNFLVGGDGYAYEGRGWDAVGAHTYGYNNQSIGIAFIGTFNNYLPSADMIRCGKQLIQKGVETGAISKDYKLLAAKQLSTTQAPGGTFYQNIKTWPHWATKP